MNAKRIDGEWANRCPRCFLPHPALNGMTPWAYYHFCGNLGKYENPSRYSCACEWLDAQGSA